MTDLVSSSVLRRFLERGGRSSPSDVASDLGADLAAVEPVLRDLARRGVLSRQVDRYAPSARQLRSLNRKLTNAAREVLNAAPGAPETQLRARARLANLVYAGVEA